MAGGRPPTPTALLSLYGGLRDDRHAGRVSEPRPEGCALPVVSLNGDALACWEHYVPRLIQMGVATEVDSHELVAMCEWWAEYRKWQTMNDENDYRRLTGMAVAHKQFASIGAKFGITARDRVGLHGANVTTDDELAGLIA